MNEHNPITVRIDEMVQVWKKNVQPHHQLIRWMLKPEEHRMYEGFCRLEASPYGKIDNLFVFFYTHSNQANTYSHALLQNWLHEYDDDQNQQLLAKAGKGVWDVTPFRKAVTENDYAACDQLLPAMIQSYRDFSGQPDALFVLGLLPKQMSSPQQFLLWMQRWMEQPKHPGIQLLVFDHVQENFWGEVFENYSDHSVTLKHDLRMQDAIRQIATAGAATDPYAFFRKCMFEMGEATNKKNKSLLNEWGAKAIESGKKTGDKSLLATAYITYAGMLFNFKDHEMINTLLDTGIRLCKQEIAGGNESLKPLLLQYYTYKGADCQIQKERKEALEWFMKAGDEAVGFEFTTQAVSAYYKAWVFADYKGWREEKLQAAKKALQLTNRLTEEEIQASEYPFMAYDYVQLQQREEDSLAAEVSAKMTGAYGDDWQKSIEELKHNYTRKKIREANKGEIMVS
ncbi:hypothetical protein A4H97_10040 [Niastella yeongjuensis]|uniref:Uncharacterized protein n=1 Tax=Niastella yeongjuensis TaxID=354355 RepID=A0A1V9EEZ9_9BACT|nr:hypothetical protein [Niastella yeongjuensis]OQP44693.1 hypothetical protein A4H97_10040 [Niastella yeongjuensis]SEO78461.1 hypothetical protein SAMN05660816_03534 [Niastella yeongjuensis]